MLRPNAILFSPISRKRSMYPTNMHRISLHNRPEKPLKSTQLILLAGQAGFATSTPLPFKLQSPPTKLTRIKETAIVWKHPIYTEKEIRNTTVAHREAKCLSDKIALGLVRLLRWCTDFVTGYRNPERNKEIADKFDMTERKWLIRFIFLESVAGVPGMVGGMLRHLKSIRRMKRDHGWIESLIDEAYNERMHLLTFLDLADPGIVMRLVVLAAQGVFFNAFFVFYLVSPKTCHRFVGYLEEEAVITYTHAIRQLQAGKLPAWDNLSAPEIAIKYWRMPEGKQRMVDLLLYVRADEAKHREVNHTLGNLDQHEDPNPYTALYHDGNNAVPSASPDAGKPIGWERDELI